MLDSTRRDVRDLATDPFLGRGSACFGKPVCRLGLASRGDGRLEAEDIHRALDLGVNFLNWPGTEDGLSRAVAELGPRRERVVVCAQFEARTASEAADELRRHLVTLATDYLDVLTFYYVETMDEWSQIIGPDGAFGSVAEARRDGVVRRIGLTTHQRGLAAEVARSGRLDALMIRYNAAHRGAESEVFPVTDALGIPVITYTALRWGALLRPTPDDPPGFEVPTASSWYRFALQSPSAAVVLMAPSDRDELEEDLRTLEAEGPLDPIEYQRLADHGRRVRRSAGGFP